MARRDRPRWGLNIKRLLENTDRTVTQIAETAGMKVQQFSNLTNNPDLNPEIRQLQRIADAFGVDIAELFVPSSQSQEVHGSSAATATPDPETLRAAVRDAIGDVLFDLLAAVGRPDAAPDEPRTDARAEQTARGKVSPGRGRAVR